MMVVKIPWSASDLRRPASPPCEVSPRLGCSRQRGVEWRPGVTHGFHTRRQPCGLPPCRPPQGGQSCSPWLCLGQVCASASQPGAYLLVRDDHDARLHVGHAGILALPASGQLGNGCRVPQGGEWKTPGALWQQPMLACQDLAAQSAASSGYISTHTSPHPCPGQLRSWCRWWHSRRPQSAARLAQVGCMCSVVSASVLCLTREAIRVQSPWEWHLPRLQ